jgi:pimeloyl-ACP methyl ester carboxylesterase
MVAGGDALRARSHVAPASLKVFLRSSSTGFVLGGLLSATQCRAGLVRARGVPHAPVGLTTVPTLFIRGDQDDTVGRAAAEGTGEFIAALYQFASLPGVGHYAADQVPGAGQRPLLLGHMKRASRLTYPMRDRMPHRSEADATLASLDQANLPNGS